MALAIVVLDRQKDSSKGIIEKVDDETKKRTNLFQFPQIEPFTYEEVSDPKLRIAGYPLKIMDKELSEVHAKFKMY